jgi:hypothetical protein
MSPNNEKSRLLQAGLGTNKRAIDQGLILSAVKDWVAK